MAVVDKATKVAALVIWLIEAQDTPVHLWTDIHHDVMKAYESSGCGSAKEYREYLENNVEE